MNVDHHDLELLFHIRCRAGDPSVTNLPRQCEASFTKMVEMQMIEVIKRTNMHTFNFYETCRLSERGRVYLDAIMKVPLPVQEWIIPEGEEK